MNRNHKAIRDHKNLPMNDHDQQLTNIYSGTLNDTDFWVLNNTHVIMAFEGF